MPLCSRCPLWLMSDEAGGLGGGGGVVGEGVVAEVVAFEGAAAAFEAAFFAEEVEFVVDGGVGPVHAVGDLAEGEVGGDEVGFELVAAGGGAGGGVGLVGAEGGEGGGSGDFVAEE